MAVTDQLTLQTLRYDQSLEPHPAFPMVHQTWAIQVLVSARRLTLMFMVIQLTQSRMEARSSVSLSHMQRIESVEMVWISTERGLSKQLALGVIIWLPASALFNLLLTTIRKLYKRSWWESMWVEFKQVTWLIKANSLRKRIGVKWPSRAKMESCLEPTLTCWSASVALPNGHSFIRVERHSHQSIKCSSSTMTRMKNQILNKMKRKS